MTTNTDLANPANMVIEEAWEILVAEVDRLTPDQCALRRNLSRRFRERRRPFTQAALSAFVEAATNAYMERQAVETEATDDA